MKGEHIDMDLFTYLHWKFNEDSESYPFSCPDVFLGWKHVISDAWTAQYGKVGLDLCRLAGNRWIRKTTRAVPKRKEKLPEERRAGEAGEKAYSERNK